MTVKTALKYFAIPFLGFLFVMTGCEIHVGTNNAMQESSQEELRRHAIEAVNEQEAMQLSDAIAQDLIAGNNEAVWQKMVKEPAVDQASIDESIDITIEIAGKIKKVEYKMNEPGVMQQSGRNVYIRKYFYAIKTSKYEMGKFFLTITIGRYGGNLYCNGFQVITFPSGPPPELL